MSQAREIYKIIQKMRDDLQGRWRDTDLDRHRLKCERDKTCEDLQAKIAKAFPDEFPLRKGEASDS